MGREVQRHRGNDSFFYHQTIWLTESWSQADNILAEAPTDGQGNIDIKKFASILTKGEEEEAGA